MWDRYYSATTLEETVDLLAQHGRHARIIAGGTDILLELERGLRPDVHALIDISRLPFLQQIHVEDGVLRFGALVTHNQVVGSDLIQKHGFPLAQAAWQVGAPQIRNRATVAGNLITASPANDTITPLMALEAQVKLVSQRGERLIPLTEFYPSYRQTLMLADEILTEIQFPTLGEDDAGIFLKLALRRAQAISVIDVAVVLRFEDPHNRRSPLKSAAIAMGCVAPTVLRLGEVENFLVGKTLTAETIQAAAQLAAQIPHPIDDVRAPAQYRTKMIEVYLRRALEALQNGTERADFPHNPAMLAAQESTAVLPHLVNHERDAADTISTTVNGQPYVVHGATHKTLLRFLREDLKLTGTKEGCAEGECGACTVFLDGLAVMACMVAAPRAHGAQIMTVEGLADEDGNLHPLQHSFMETGAVQCGFCTPGFLMAGAKLLEEHPHPTREQIEQGISGNLCRCTGYYKILEAFERAQDRGDSNG